MIEIVENYHSKNGRTVNMRFKNNGKDYLAQVYYDVGGPNYFSGRSVRRGYYLLVTPITVETTPDGYTWVTQTVFAGIKELLQEAKRFNRKVLDDTANIFDAPESDEQFNKLLNYVLAKNGELIL